jgi:succinoglycan biosynthesis transport protein ExoP
MNDSPETMTRLSMRDVLYVIFSKLHVFVGIYVFIVLTTLVLAFLLPPLYQVTGNVLVKPQLEPNLKLLAPAPSSMRANPVTPQDINSEVQLLKSPQLLRQVVRRLELDRPEPSPTWLGRLLDRTGEMWRRGLISLGVAKEVSPEEEAVLNLQKELDIKPVTLSNLVEISLKGVSPATITKIVNTLLEHYIEYHIQVYQPKGAKEFYARQAEMFRQNLKAAEDNLKKFKNKYGVIDLTAQNEANVELLRNLRENLALVEAKIKERQLKVGVQAQNLAKTGDIGALTPELQSNLLEELLRVLGPLLAERERLALHYQQTSPKLQAADRQVQALKAAYRKQVAELLKGAQLDVSALSRYSRILERYLKDIGERSLLLSQKQVEYEGLVREVKQNEKNYLMYLTKTEEARIEEQQEASRAANVTVTTWAEVPTVPVFPKKFLMLALALSLGFIVALAGAFCAYYLDHTIKTPDDLARDTRLPVFATIDLISRRMD